MRSIEKIAPFRAWSLNPSRCTMPGQTRLGAIEQCGFLRLSETAETADAASQSTCERIRRIPSVLLLQHSAHAGARTLRISTGFGVESAQDGRASDG